MTAYYNEIDPCAAAWLRELIKAGHIAPGVVDERSIEDVTPNDLRGFTQCHFFAGIGVWSYALRLAGWPDNRPIWTASCPCQPFSSSGRRGGFDDERHLWPHLQWLVQQRRPTVLVGEQVASKAAEPWVDLVQADLEAMGYAFGCVAFPSAGVGAPHIRDRAYWVGVSGGEGLEGLGGGHTAARRHRQGPLRPVAEASESVGVADNQGGKQSREMQEPGTRPDTVRKRGTVRGRLHAGGVEDPNSQRRNRQQIHLQPGRPQQTVPETAGRGSDSWPGPTNGLWRNADWLHCRDGKWRPVEPGTFPLANGAPARVGRLRGYGNAINAEAARAFIEALL